MRIAIWRVVWGKNAWNAAPVLEVTFGAAGRSLQGPGEIYIDHGPL